MARPFDDSLHYQQVGSSLSSQTLLAGGRVYSSQADGPSSSLQNDRAGASWDNPRLTQDVSSRKHPRPKLAKIKSSPSHGALAAARASHAKIHRRGKSATSPTSPTFVPEFLLQNSSSMVPGSAHADPYASPERKTSSKRVKIKPLLRKFTSQENVSIDLSRSAAENEGLGIYSSSDFNRLFEAGSNRGYHDRTTSATSQFSTTTSSSNRPGAQFVHPMRQTPRPYTPPIASSYKTSLDSEAPTTVTTTSEVPFFDTHSRQASSNTTTTPTSYAPLPSTRRPPPIHVRTGSATRLTSSSQTNLPGTPSSLRFNNTDTINPPEMVSPTTRSSLESTFRIRSRSNTANTNTDPVVQAATVQQMRRQFQEKEAAKELKYQQAEARAQEKEAKRQEKREDSERRISEKRERKRGRSNAASEKSSFMSPAEQPVQMIQTQSRVSDGPPQRKRGDTAGSAGKAARSKWSLFWFRFRTMWLRLKKKLLCS